MARNKLAHIRKKEIIAGFYECLSRTGHEQITIKDIAKAANVSYGVMHYYFANKKEIVLALVEDYVRQQEILFEDLVSPIDSPWERLEKLVSLSVDRFIFDQKTNMVFLNLYQMACNDKDIRHSLMSGYEHFRKVIRDIVEYGISRGQFKKVDSGKFSLFFVGCVEGIFLQISMNPTLCARKTVRDILYESARLWLGAERDSLKE
jgi:AcrR family transcriptional regulator